MSFNIELLNKLQNPLTRSVYFKPFHRHGRHKTHMPCGGLNGYRPAARTIGVARSRTMPGQRLSTPCIQELLRKATWSVGEHTPAGNCLHFRAPQVAIYWHSHRYWIGSAFRPMTMRAVYRAPQVTANSRTERWRESRRLRHILACSILNCFTFFVCLRKIRFGLVAD